MFNYTNQVMGEIHFRSLRGKIFTNERSNSYFNQETPTRAVFCLQIHINY